MNRRYPLAVLALGAAASLPSTAHAAGPWTVANPQGITWTAPTGCTLVLDLATSDGYPERFATSQRYELVIAYRNGVEIGRTDDLSDMVAQASAFKRITAPVNPGDTVTVTHSSLAGLLDGTANSVTVAASFTCTPPQTTVPTATTMPTATTTTTTSVAVTTPPAPTTPPPVVSSTLVTTPRPPASTTVPPATTVPPFVLPETGAATNLALFLASFLVGIGIGARTIARRPR